MDMRLLPFFTVLATLAGCVACDAAPRQASVGPAALSLTSLGAKGDGRRDDREALERAIAKAGGRCIDGGGRSYRIVGTVEAAVDTCLTNMTLVQGIAIPDTRPFVAGRCRVDGDASKAWSCGDPAVPRGEADRMQRALAVRTLLIRPPSAEAPISVRLSDVRVDRGDDPSAGSRDDSAGIWIQYAKGVQIDGLAITGHGKGYGLFVVDSRDIRVEDLKVHDMHWSPYRGERLDLATVRRIGWNRMPIHEIRAQDGEVRFLGVRVQEQLVGARFTNVHNVRLSNLRIERIEARLVDETLPWQTDGLTISGDSENIEIDGLHVARSWENVDIKGNHGGIHGLTIRNADLSDSFNFGLKIGGDVSAVSLEDARIRRAGKAGVMLYGDVSRARLSRVDIAQLGEAPGERGAFSAYPVAAIAGVEILANEEGIPRGVMFDAVEVSGTGHGYGLFSRGGIGIGTKGLKASGSRVKAVDIGAAN